MTTETDIEDVRAEDVRAVLAIFSGRPCSHCSGTGREPLRHIPETWRPVLARLYAANKHRKENSERRDFDGYLGRHDAYRAIRRLVGEARGLGIPVSVAAETMDLSPSQLYNILKKDTAESGRDAG